MNQIKNSQTEKEIIGLKMSKFFQASIKKGNFVSKSKESQSESEDALSQEINKPLKKRTRKAMKSPQDESITPTNILNNDNICSLNENNKPLLNDSQIMNESEEDEKKVQWISSPNVYKLISEGFMDDHPVPETTQECTSINKLNLSTFGKRPIVTFIQKDKIKLLNYNIMLDVRSQTFINEWRQGNCQIPCFYCRRKFTKDPLGVPVRYFPSVYLIKHFNSPSLKYACNYKEVTVRLNVREKQRLLQIIENNQESLLCNDCPMDETETIESNNSKKNTNFTKSKEQHLVTTKEFFETEGIVCSFNCMASYIDENSSNPLFMNSRYLMYLLYQKLFGSFPQNHIMKAPSWKLRKEYGGPFTDEEYEQCLQNISISESKQLRRIPSSFESETVFEILM